MPDWATFVGLTAVLVVLLLALSRTSQRVLEAAVVVDGDGDPKLEDAAAPTVEGSAAPTGEDAAAPTVEDAAERARNGPHVSEERPEPGAVGRSERAGRPRITTRALLGNVVVSQVLFLGLLVAAAWWTGVPAAAFGLAAETLTFTRVWYGVVAGVLIYGGNEVGAAASERFGFSAPERLRSAMAPTNAAEWALLLLVVLPVIAVFEELLFRGALIGVVNAGFGISPWLLAVVSSAVFGLGHGTQGRVGVVVTGLLGFVLAAVFVVTWSLPIVIVAHYVINTLEFTLREGLGWEPLAR